MQLIRVDSNSEERSAPHWMVTFADMMFLLLAFFVLLFSFSSIQQSKFSELAGSMRGAFGVLSSGDTIRIHDQASVPSAEEIRIAVQHGLMLSGLEELSARISPSGEQMQIVSTADEVRIRLSDQLLFDSGSDSLQPAAHLVLDDLGELLNSVESEVIVEGHTDDVPIRTARFPSNWELASGRALTTVRELNDRGIAADRLSATSFGEFRPITSNQSAEGRAINRRVEMRVLLPSPQTLAPSSGSES